MPSSQEMDWAHSITAVPGTNMTHYQQHMDVPMSHSSTAQRDKKNTLKYFRAFLISTTLVITNAIAHSDAVISAA